MSNIVTTQFGGETRSFGFNLNEIEELQRQCGGVGIGTIIERVMENQFYYADIVHTLRLGLIGSGECSPSRAMELVETYVIGKPLAAVLAAVRCGNLWGHAETPEFSEGVSVSLASAPGGFPGIRSAAGRSAARRARCADRQARARAGGDGGSHAAGARADASPASLITYPAQVTSARRTR